MPLQRFEKDTPPGVSAETSASWKVRQNGPAAGGRRSGVQARARSASRLRRRRYGRPFGGVDDDAVGGFAVPAAPDANVVRCGASEGNRRGVDGEHQLAVPALAGAGSGEPVVI